MIAELSIQFLPVGPRWLLLLVAGALLAAMLYGTVSLVRKGIPGKWVIALGLLRLGAWIVFVLILLQPVVASTQSVARLPELAILVDTSASMALPSDNNGSRLDEVRSHLDRGDLGGTLRKDYRLHWFTFDRSAARHEPGEIKDAAATGPTTHFAESLTGAIELLRAEDHRPQRVLLVSDGHDHGEEDVVQTARRLGVTIDVLAPTAKMSEKATAVEIADVQAARRVLLGSETHFRVTLRARQPIGAERKLTLAVVEEGKVIQELPVTMKPSQAEQVLLLAHRPAALGMKTYDFQLREPDDEEAASVRKLPIQVVDGKYEILVLEDTWRWEYKYLHRLFEDDPSFRFTALLSRGGGAFVQFGSPDRRVNQVGFPQTRAELEGFDLFFLGDVDASRWPKGLPAALAQAIAEQGKSLVVIGGPGLANLADIPELHALLPVDLSRESGKPIIGPVEVRLRPEAAASSFFFQLGSEADRLPPVDFVYPAKRKRPGATVLLETTQQRNDFGPLIVLAEHTVGRGRVLFVGTDTLWKWQTLAEKDGPTPYSIFWQQAMRALTPQRSKLGTTQLWLTPSRTRAEAGRPLDIEAEIDSDRPVPQSRLEATVTTPAGRRALTFSLDPAHPQRFHAELVPAQAGSYRIDASVTDDGKTIADASSSLQVEEAAGEANDIGIDTANLQRIAASTGGRWIDPTNSETWPVADGESAETMPQLRTYDLWNSFALLLVLCGILGTDWFLRVFKGLV
jgi:hypothetical protein